MRVVVDTSTLITLARAGWLPLLEKAGVQAVLLDVVRDEAVSAGLAGGHADAAAIETVIAGLPVTETTGPENVDAVVADWARRVGVLVSNDLALGRRVRNLGAAWVRSADLAVLAHHRQTLSRRAARAAIESMRHAGRITGELADQYLEELR